MNETSNYSVIAALVVLLPLVGSSLWFWLKPKLGEKLVGVFGTAAIAIPFFCVVYLFKEIQEPLTIKFFSWIPMGDKSLVDFAFRLDPLSLMLGLIVTGVGSLIHVYASGYMHGDEGFGRFFSYLNLFVFAMMMLIWSDSLPGIFLGWEGVGLCSYLLISFWFTDEANATAGKKAFIVNRVGDFGFLIALFCLFRAFGTLSVQEILSLLQSGGLTETQIEYSTWACFGLILGAAGKSAQIPLYVWLPDAMAGPTPVSALIHAATMVTAGVYLTCRLQGLFILNTGALEVIAYIGGLTALFAASIAVFQNDIKKVLAYSTISQLGYMFLAVGLMAPVAAYFHLITHAFFKALLFLGAGSVIHGLHHEQDMRNMGGLRKQMPITFWAMTIGVLAIAGIPPLSGFVSKDQIIAVAKESHRPLLILFAFATSFLTAFYMARLWVMTFFGKFRGEHEAHESPLSMTSVLIILAILSVVGGLLNWPHYLGGGEWLSQYFGSVVVEAKGSGQHSWGMFALKVGMSLAAIGLAFWKYRGFEASSPDFRSSAFELFKQKYYIDELYDFLIVRNLRRLGEFQWKIVDQSVIDGILHGFANLSKRLGENLRRLQTGQVQGYLLLIWLGLIGLIVFSWLGN